MSVQSLPIDLEGVDFRVGVVCARFNEPITEGLRKACLDELLALGVQPGDIIFASVPGALEIPLVLKRMAMSGEFDALVALGAVIRGETYHFEVVSDESARGIGQVALETGLPIANGVLTCDTDEQAMARVLEKGRDCARTAVEMANLVMSIEEVCGLDDEEFED